MLALIGIMGAAVLMAFANEMGNDLLFMISGALLLLFGVKYFKR